MLDTRQFGADLEKLGFDFFTGVPCSFLKSLINYAINSGRYVMAANEGDAVAVAAGAALGGRRAVCLMQNSGLTNATSPLTSLTWTLRVPVLAFVSWRGEPGRPDEPQHELMGQITAAMLDLMRIRWAYLAADAAQAREQLAEADRVIRQDESFFFVVRDGTFGDEPLAPQTPARSINRLTATRSGADEQPTRLAALEVLNRLKDDDTALLAATGKTGRELYEIEDAPNNLYMVGSMGCVSSLGLGLALARPAKRIVAIDGDGALLMRMGSLATNAYYHPANLLHVVLDNHSHDSTGGQATVSHNVDFVSVAAASGYPKAVHAHSLREFEQAYRAWQADPCLTFLHLDVARGSKAHLGRPKVAPHEVKTRLMAFLNRTSPAAHGAGAAATAGPRGAVTTAVILAAGMGTRLQGLTRGMPKGFISIGGTTLIERSIANLRAAGIERILIGTGHGSDAYEALAARMPQVTCIRNPHYAESGSMRTLHALREAVDGDFLLLESDLLYDRRGLRTLLDRPEPNVILASGRTDSRDEVFIETDGAGRLVAMSKSPSDLRRIDGELVGITRVSLAAFRRLCAWAAERFAGNPRLDYEHALVGIARDEPIRVLVEADYAWCEIDDADHLRRAEEQVYPRIRERESCGK